MDTATATEDLSNVLRLLYVAYDGTELGCKDVVGSIQHVYRDQGKEFLTVQDAVLNCWTHYDLMDHRPTFDGHTHAHRGTGFTTCQNV